MLTVNLAEVTGSDFLGPSWWKGALAWALALALFRSTPAALYALGGRRIAWPVRLSALSMLAGGLVCVWSVGSSRAELPYFLAGLAYFSGLGVLVHRLGAGLRGLAINQGALFCLAAIACVLVPSLALPFDEANVVRLMGFELALSIYSYLSETRSGRAQCSLREALFFLIVNPTLVLPERGSVIGEPQLSLVSARKLAFGMCALVLSVFAAQASLWLPAGAAPEATATPGFRADAPFSYVFASYGVATYLAHSGSASVQIAWMRALGWEVPERYRFPILATSPTEFWQRWNTYVGAWLRRYVFMPATLHLRRRHRRLPPLLTQGAAVMVTFLACGALHDLTSYPPAFALSIAWTVAFVGVGAMVLAWVGLELRLRSAITALPAAMQRPLAAAALAFGYLVTAQHLVAMYWLLDPKPSGTTHAAVSALLGLDRMGF